MRVRFWFNFTHPLRLKLSQNNKNNGINKDMISIEKQKRYGIFYSLMITVGYLTASFVAMLLSKTKVSIFANAVQPIIFFVCCLFFIKSENEDIKQVLPIKKVSAIFVLSAIFLFIGLFFGLGQLNVKFSEVLVNAGVKINALDISANNFFEYLLNVFVLSISPAFGEEILFRGVVLFCLSTFSLGKGEEKDKIIISLINGILFSIFHKNLAQLIYQFVYGFVLAYLTLKTKNILIAVIMHFLNNFIILTQSAYFPKVNLYNTATLIIGLVLFVVGLVLAFFIKVCVFLVKKYFVG